MKSDNNLYGIIRYVYSKTIYIYIYTIPYDVRLQMIIPKHILVYIRINNDELI